MHLHAGSGRLQTAPTIAWSLNPTGALTRTDQQSDNSPIRMLSSARLGTPYSPKSRRPPANGIVPPVRSGSGRTSDLNTSGKVLVALRRLVISLLCVVALGASVDWLWRRGASASQSALAAAKSDPAVPVMAAEAGRRDVPVYLTGLGTVRAYKSVVLTSRVDGQIVKIDFDEGQNVHRGDVLVEVDPQPFAAALAQAQAAELRDEALLANARLDFNRAQDLAGKGSGTRQQLDTTRAQVAQFEASTKIDQAAITAAQVQLNYCQIRSPIDGRTGTRQVDEGNIVRANSTSGIVTINQIQPISVDFDLPAESLPEVRAHLAAGETTAVALDRDDHPLATGKLAVVDNQVNVATGTVRYKATFENKDEKLWPGQFVSIRLQIEVQHDALTVPNTAVLRGPEGTFVFVVTPAHVAAKRAVKLGFTNKELSVIESGLEAGELVVTDGQYRIQSGTLVNVLPQTAQDTPRAPTP